jgi:hypothetical protein
MPKPTELDPREALRNCGIHARQINEQIAEADKQRSDAVAAGDLDAVRRINRRVSDLKNDLVTLAEGRALFEARVAKLDSEERIAACDAAIEKIGPPAAAIIALVEELEAELDRAAATKVAIDAKYAEYRDGYPKILPKLEWYRDFNLSSLDWQLKTAMEHCAREGFHKIGRYIDHHNGNTGESRKPSAALRESLATFVDNLRSSVREREDERATKEAKVHVGAE